jgi:hypothetical protein
MTESPSKPRRPVQYLTMASFRADAEKLAAGRYETVGNWTFGQILCHLADAINASLDGFPFRTPWFVRLLVGPLFKKSILSKPLKPGFKLPKSAEPYLPPPDVSTADGLGKLLAAIARLEHETPEAEHPFFGRLTPEEWTKLHLKHAELHMSFVRPA